jgi:hypothetical protein
VLALAATVRVCALVHRTPGIRVRLVPYAAEADGAVANGVTAPAYIVSVAAQDWYLKEAF